MTEYLNQTPVRGRSMSEPDFLELKVFQAAEQLADAVHGAVKRWDEFSRNTVGERLVKALDGVGAGIAAGAGHRMAPDDRRAIRAALYETVYWLRRASKRKMLNAAQLAQIQPTLDDLSARVRSLLKRARQKGEKPGDGPDKAAS